MVKTRGKKPEPRINTYFVLVLLATVFGLGTYFRGISPEALSTTTGNMIFVLIVLIIALLIAKWVRKAKSPFGYTCPECGKGKLQERVIPEYHTEIKGYPFIVKKAHIGICNQCGYEYLAACETDKWEKMFEKDHKDIR